MKHATTLMYTALQVAMAKTYGVPEVKDYFNVSTPMETRLNDAIQQSDDFLQRINVVPVTDITGQAVLIDAAGQPLARRTDTDQDDRETTDLADPDGCPYTCVKTEYDVHMKYAQLDTWARFPDFQQRYTRQVYRRIALDRILVGWHGEQAAKKSNPVTYRLRQDINIGWLKLLQTHHADNYLTQSGETVNQIKLGPGGDYRNLDQMVFDVYNLISPEQRTGLEVAIIGQNLVAHDMGKIHGDWGQRPTEKSLIRTLSKSYAGLPCLMVPHFPDMGLMVTDLRNLSIYYQSESVRRRSWDNPKRDRIEDYNSMNEAYMIENPRAAAAVHAANVKLVN
jgi:P2 family phage major capsid protein